MHYSEILPLINNGWDYQWDNNAKCPYLVKNDQSQIITYDNPLSIQRKSEFAKDRNLGGVMVWALGYDNMNTSESLTAAIHTHWLHTENEKRIVPENISLNAYPNPFNPQITINFDLPYRNKIVLDIFDMNGRLVDNVLNGFFEKGHHSHIWDPLSNKHTLSSGIYIVSLNGEGMRANNKILYVK